MKRRQWLILGIGSLLVVVLLVLLLQGRDRDKRRPLPRFTRQRIETPSIPPPSFPPTRSGTAVPPPIERGKGVAVVASSRMVEQRAVEFSNLVNAVWSAELGTIFAQGDGSPVNVKVPPGMEVNSLEQALLRCAISLLLWDEEVNQGTIKALKDYCETGGWLAFVSCPWIGSPPKSSPAELLGPRSFEGIAYVGAPSQDRKAFALLKHPSLPELPVGERLRVYLQSSKALSGGEGRKIPLIRFEDPALRGITIQAMGHGGVVELNWDCPAGGRIGETDSQEFIRTVLAWLSGKDTWKEPVEQPGISLKVIARTLAGAPAPGAQISVKVHTDWAKPFDQQLVTTDENGEADMPAKAPAIYTAWAAGEGYSSDNLALGRVQEGTVPGPLVVIVRPSLRIVGTAVYTGEKTGPASDVQVDLLPSSRARGMDVVSTKADEEGRFVFNQVPGGRPYLLRSETEEWAALEEIDLPESTETGTFEVTLSLKKLVAIDGRVVEEGEEQKPIEGATVHVEPSWGVKALPLFLQHLRGKSTSTGGEGEFGLPVLPELTYQVKAEAPGYIWREQDTDEEHNRTREGWLEVGAPATVTLALYAGTGVTGIVYLPGGQPAPGAEVRLIRFRNSLTRQDSVQMSGVDGRFCFSCVATSQRSSEESTKSATLTARCGAFSGTTIVSFPLHQSQIEVVLNLREPPRVEIRGMVTDMQERPVANATLFTHWRRDYGSTGRSDGEGFFEVQLPTEEYVGEQTFPRELGLHVWKEGYEAVDVGRAELEAAARDSHLIHVALPRSNGRVAGRVLLDDGTPLRNETVDLEARNEQAIGSLSLCTRRGAILGEGGEFQLETIRVEAWGSKVFEEPIEVIDLKVDWHPDPSRHDLRVTAFNKGIRLGTSDVVVRFGPIGTLRGRFVSAENGAPLSEVSVLIIREGIVRQLRTGTSGEFRFPWVSVGEYALKAVCSGFFPDQRTIGSDGTDKHLGDIVLHKILTVTGQAVYKESRLAVDGAEVRIEAIVQNSGRPPSVAVMDCAQGTTDSTGRFTLKISNPFDDRQDGAAASHRMALGLKKGTTRKSLDFDPSQAGAVGILDLGRIELEAPEQR